jgi:glycerol-1-phosphate dehydrogenase [NAD(P)+]
MIIIDGIPQILYSDLKKLEDKRRIILFTSPSAWKIAKSFLRQLGISDIVYIKSSNEKEVTANIVNLVSKKNNFDVCYAIGGGMVTDVAKYYAYKISLPLIIIPTLISTDAFLVNCTGIRSNGCVKYVSAVKAERILVDFNLLEKTPLRFHLSGCGDVLSIFTGLFDWQYANLKNKHSSDEVYSTGTARIAESILEGLINQKDEIRQGSKKGIKTILDALIMEVQLCNIYGNSRPEEGGEHFFTYCVENKVPHFLHGEMVSAGILITSFLQNQNWCKMYDFMTYVGLRYIPDGLTEKIIFETLEELPIYVKTHNLRYSIYNDFSFNKNKGRLRKFIRYILKE